MDKDKKSIVEVSKSSDSKSKGKNSNVKPTEKEKDSTIPTKLKLLELQPFKEHPFNLYNEEKMNEMADSIKEYGVFMPILVRPRDNGYEIISGHNRVEASKRAGLKDIIAYIKDVDDEIATIMMVDSNLKQRESLLPSEKARAYKMKLDAIKRQGERSDLTSAQIVPKLQAREIVANDAGENRMQITRYIRLTELIPPLLEMVDEKKIPLNSAVELSFLSTKLQEELVEIIEIEECIPTLAQAQRIKVAAQEGKLDRNGIELVLSEEKPSQNKVILKAEKIDKYFPKDFTPKQREEMIYKALDMYCKKLERQRKEQVR